MFGLMLLLAYSAPIAQAQQQKALATTALSNAPVEENLNLDIEIYLLAAADTSAEGGRLPNQLEPVVKQLRSSLPFGSYRLSATMLNRMKNGGRLSVKGVGVTPFSKIVAPAPLFSEYSVNSVTLKNDAAGQSIVELVGFRFGAKIPIQTGSPATEKGASVPIVQYENTGIYTDFSMREGEPVVVGTLNVGQPGEAFILVVAAKRTAQR
jgi:hypothetical protein